MSVAPGPVDDPLGLDAHIRAIPDFPEPGITFRDLTPLLADGPVLARSIDGLVEAIGETVGSVDVVAGIEARGFLLGPPVALRLGVGFVPVRKPGKLPWQVEAETYALEYGTDTVEVHVDALIPGQRVLVVDDLVATGGTAAATSRLVDRLGAEVAGFAFLVELTALEGRTVLGDAPVVSLLGY